MLYIKGLTTIHSLGNRIFHCDGSDRYVLCNTPVQAGTVLNCLGLSVGTIKQCASLDATSIIKHMCGERLTILHRNERYTCDTLLACGSPATMDTTRPLNIVWKKSEYDNS